MAVRQVALCCCALAVAACDDERVRGHASLADDLPANCHSVVAWQPGAPELPPLPVWLRDALDLGRIDARIAPRGAIGWLTATQPDRLRTTPVHTSLLAFADREDLARARAKIDTADRGVRASGLRLVVEPEPWPDGYERVAARLGAQSWFRATSEGLGEHPGDLRAWFDLRELRSALEGRSPRFRAIERAMPGLSSFLTLGVSYARPSQGIHDYGAFVRLARTPVGIAKALDLPPAPLVLPSLFMPIAPGDSLIVLRLDGSVLIAAMQVLVGSANLGLFGPGPADVLRSMNAGFVFRRDLWASLANEWAIVVPRRAGSFVAAVRLADSKTLLDVVADIERKPSSMVRLKTAQRDGVTHIDFRILGRSLRVLVARDFALIAPAGSAARLEQIAKRHAARDLAPWHIEGEPPELNGYARIAPGLLGRFGVVQWMQRVRDGIRVSGRIR